jgi:hypothetical protein
MIQNVSLIPETVTLDNVISRLDGFLSVGIYFFDSDKNKRISVLLTEGKARALLKDLSLLLAVADKVRGRVRQDVAFSACPQCSNYYATEEFCPFCGYQE